jgi:hypothetical protein
MLTLSAYEFMQTAFVGGDEAIAARLRACDTHLVSEHRAFAKFVGLPGLAVLGKYPEAVWLRTSLPELWGLLRVLDLKFERSVRG